MGGAGDPALSAIEAALKAGKSVVTANKALIAKHGLRLAQARREARRRAEFRGGGRRRDPGHQDACAKGFAGNRHQARLRHPQRHLQLHPDADGAGGPVVRRMPEGCAAARLCRSRSVLRRRRPRHRAEACDPRQPRLRHQGRRRARSMSKASPRSRRTICAPPTNSATASSCSASRCGPPSGIEQRVHPTMVPKIVLDRAGDGRHQRGDHRRRGHPADHAGRARRRRRCDRLGRRRRHRRRRARHSRRAVRASGRHGCAATSKAPMERHEGGYYIRLLARDLARHRRHHRHPACGTEDFAGIDRAAPSRRASDRRTARTQEGCRPVPVILITYATTEDAVRRALAAVQRDKVISGRPQVIRIEKN